MKARLYHNPRCSKSRQTLELLDQKGVEPEIVEYLKTPPSEQELKTILRVLNIQPRELMRCNEAEYKENNLANESLTPDELIAAMVQYPKLIQRPILVINDGEKVAIGRPPEAVLDII